MLLDGQGRADDIASVSTPERTAPAASTLRRTLDRLEARPIAVVAVCSVATAVASAVWIWSTRQLGSYDPDEAGYLAAALRFHRQVASMSPVGLLREIGKTSNGPLVPLLSQPFLVLGPRDPRSAMLVQPVLLVVTSLAVAGIGRRLAGPWTAILSGCVVATLPTMTFASQAYWYGLGAATCAAVAVWALLASDRFSNPFRWLYGVALGAMLLTRTMALGFAPGLVLAGLVVAWGDRRRVGRLAQVIAVGLVIAAPWWIARRAEIFDYLFSYGYGERAGLWGSGGPLQRLGNRVWDVATGVLDLEPLVILAAAGLVWSTWSWWRSRRARGAAVPLSEHERRLLAVASFCVVGIVALASTTNQGVWFELPVVVVALPLGAALLGRATPWIRLPLLASVCVIAVASPITMRASGTGHADDVLARHDPRFSNSSSERHRVAATEWRELSEQVEEELQRLTAHGSTGIVELSGNTLLFNTNTVGLAAELRLRPLPARVPDTVQPRERRAAHLEPVAEGELRPDGTDKERILVVALHDHRPFDPDAEVAAFHEQAVETGWVTVSRYAMPRGGWVLVMRHELNLGAAG